MLTRGVAGPRALGAALDEMQVDSGEEFILAPFTAKVLQAIGRVPEVMKPQAQLSDDEIAERLVREFDGKEETDAAPE